MAQREMIKSYGIILPAVAEMIEEQHLSKDEAMAALWRFLGNEEQPSRVLKSIGRLQSAEDEGELGIMLRQECLRMLKLGEK